MHDAFSFNVILQPSFHRQQRLYICTGIVFVCDHGDVSVCVNDITSFQSSKLENRVGLPYKAYYVEQLFWDRVYN